MAEGYVGIIIFIVVVGSAFKIKKKKINLKWTFRIDCWQSLRGQLVTLFQFWGYHDSSSPSSSLWNIDVGIRQKCSKWRLYYWQLVGNSSLTKAIITLPGALPPRCRPRDPLVRHCWFCWMMPTQWEPRRRTIQGGILFLTQHLYLTEDLTVM